MKKTSSQPLTETPVPGNVDDEYFYRMLSPYALKLSAPYNDEESEVLERCLESYPAVKDMNFVAVGGENSGSYGGLVSMQSDMFA
jgi:hypothetical protein